MRVAVFVAVRVGVRLGNGDEVNVAVLVGGALGSGAGVREGSGVFVFVGMTGVDVGVAEIVAVGRGVLVADAVAVTVGKEVFVAVAVGGTGVAVGVKVGRDVLVSVGCWRVALGGMGDEVGGI